MEKEINPKKSTISPIIIIALVLVLLIGVGFIYANSRSSVESGPNQNQTDAKVSSSPEVASSPAYTATAKSSASTITWMQTEEGYRADSTPPTCPNQMVATFPADLTQATSVLYPGQFRGGNYKPHGGLRFDNAKSNNLNVVAPFDGTIIDGAAYIADGSVDDVQYTFDVMNDCGMMFRLGHLLTLSPAMTEIAKAFPAPVKNESRTTQINPGVKITAGTVMATAVGTSSDKNIFFDWGVYNWNQANAISTNAAWLAETQHNSSLAKHAVCWFDQLSEADAATIRRLPAADPTAGKTSDFCK